MLKGVYILMVQVKQVDSVKYLVTCELSDDIDFVDNVVCCVVIFYRKPSCPLS